MGVAVKSLLYYYIFAICIFSILASKDQNQNENHFKIIQDLSYDATKSYSVLYSDEGNGEFKVVDGIQEDGSAFAVYQGDQSLTGWAYLSVNTSSLYNDSIQSYSAGYIEGYLTYEMIYYQRYNYLMNTFNSDQTPQVLIDWIYENIDFMKQSMDNASSPDFQNETLSQYWETVSLSLSQVRGIVDGYNAGRLESTNSTIQNTELFVYDIFILNMYGDLFELIPALNISKYNLTTDQQLSDYLHTSGHCTSMVKITDDLSEIYAAHTTFDFYFTMIRIFKSYYFSYSSQSGIQTRNIMFSSYPGCIISIDDFYQMDSGLVVLETTNSLITQDLYYLIKPQSVLYWLRMSAANKMSTSPLQWCQWFSEFNSGTYNNQYTVLDFKKFVPYFGIQEGGLYVLEQTPVVVQYADQTYTLRNGYFPGFNIPYYYNIYNISGYVAISNNTLNTYQGAARSQIFRRQANSIKTLEDAKDFMRYNDWVNDPLSYGDPWNAICARGDQTPESKGGPVAAGCIDTKLTSYSMYQQGTVIAISSPTTSHGLKPFDWNHGDWNTTHQGLIDYWNYEWVTFTNSTYLSYK